ncbi:MAG: DUF3857 domain-containing protein [Myxococcota bacterium]
MAALVVPALGQAQAKPYEQRQIRLARDVERLGRRPEGMVPLLQLWRTWEKVDPSVTRSRLERLAESRRLSPARRAYVGALLARAEVRAGDVAASRDRIRDLGYVTRWRVVGPFDNEGKSGFDRELPPEAARREPVDVSATWPGKERPVSWRDYPERSARLGYVDFDAVFRPNTQACAFAETFVHAPKARPMSVWVGGGGAVKVWWNGERVLEDGKYRRPHPDRHVATVGAHEGTNRLLVKVCVDETAWGFFLRMGDASGAPLPLEADPKRQGPGPAGHADLRLPDGPAAPLAALEEAAAGDSAGAAEQTRLARFLAYSGADDPAEQRARQLAARAADAEPSVDRLRLAASLAETRSEVMRFVERARELKARDPDVLLMHAQLLAGGPTPEDALEPLGRIPDRGRTGLEAALLRADILAQLDLAESALRVVERAAERAPESVRFTRALADAVVEVGHADRYHELQEAMLALRYDDLGTRRTLLADAMRRDDEDELASHLTALQTLATTPNELSYIAHVHEARGEPSRALEAFERARSIAPEDAGVLAAQGKMLLRMGQRDAAALSLRDALTFKPQDAPTRELLEQIEGPEEERADERYALGRRELLARRSQGTGYPLTVLQQLTVNTVYDNGLGSSFRQVAAQVHDDEGARRWRTYSIRFDPTSQRVRVRRARVYRADGTVLEARRTFEQRLGEPWYRIYYDTRALVVVFPDLKPGDVVELRYRIDDIAHRNLFADYYGDLRFVQDFLPTRHFEYVLITPRKRDFHWHEPELEGLAHEREHHGDRRIDRYEAKDLPAIRSEDGMPGMTEIAPFLHVSTYGGWQEIGRWYWGLIQDQLYADESLRRTVAELLEGARDTREKVTRIHAWVLENTRYVGLEFGIHGYKPYRVTQVVRRGFGDCKDKASLLYAMLREAGIDAHIVLVRTRRNGDIPDEPASLAVFDHAVTYVPSLDLYIDGTAEHSGTTELPVQDQGAVVLHVWPDGSELRRTPVLPPERNRRTRVISAELAEDGSAAIEARGEARGGDAAAYRSRYRAGGTREERFERTMRGTFPGMDLRSLQFDSLDDLEKPVSFRYAARVPQLAQRDGGGLRVAPSTLDDLVRGLARTATRRHPLDLGGTTSYVEERTLTPPAGFRPASVPDGGEVESRFGRLGMALERDGRKVRVRTELEIRTDRVAPKDYPAFRRWVQAADALLRQRLRFEEGE